MNIRICYGILIIKPTRCTNFSDLFLEWNSFQFHSKNKFEELVNLVRFIIRKKKAIFTFSRYTLFPQTR